MTKKELRISASQINLFDKEPLLWVARYFYGIKEPSNIYAIRGKLVELYINMKLESNNRAGVSYPDYREQAIKDLMFDGVHVIEEDLTDFYTWGDNAYNVLDEEVPANSIEVELQTEVKGKIKGVELKGFLDFNYKKLGYAIDLKSASKLPTVVSRGKRKGMLSTTKADNIRQQVIYTKLTGLRNYLLYVTATGESLFYEVTQRDVDEQWDKINDIVAEMQELWKLMLDNKIDDVKLKYKINNPSSMYWGEESLTKAYDILS